MTAYKVTAGKLLEGGKASSNETIKNTEVTE